MPLPYSELVSGVLRGKGCVGKIPGTRVDKSGFRIGSTSKVRLRPEGAVEGVHIAAVLQMVVDAVQQVVVAIERWRSSKRGLSRDYHLIVLG